MDLALEARGGGAAVAGGGGPEAAGSVAAALVDWGAVLVARLEPGSLRLAIDFQRARAISKSASVYEQRTYLRQLRSTAM